jgi:hypothetical protein
MISKSLKYVLFVAFCVFLASCLDVEEEIVVNADGSGSYATKTDMGPLIDMMQTFAGEEALQKDGLDKVVDTTIYMKNMIDSVKKLTPEQKELMKAGKTKVQMNVKEKLFKINSDFTYKNYNSLQQLMGGQGGNGAALTNLFKGMFGGAQKGMEGLDQPADPAGADSDPMGAVASMYDVVVKNGVISKVINAAKFKALNEKPEIAQLKQLGASGMEISYTTTIKLPRPAKKVDNPLIKLSDDKKTVTFKYNMLELLDTPEKFSYTILY